VFAMINIVGLGQAGGKYDQDLNDMEVTPTAEMALKYKGIIVGVKSAHYAGPEWDPFTRAGLLDVVPRQSRRDASRSARYRTGPARRMRRARRDC
jgi:hypothetical protein